MAAVGPGWAGNSVNTVVFRKNPLASVGDTQFIAWYNQQGFVVVGKRSLRPGSNFTLRTTGLRGNIADAHNTISIMADGNGYLHMAWDHHNNKLHYVKSVAPYALEFEPEQPMTGLHETKVSYPEFYRLANGDLLFFYRDGGSGQGNLVINRYALATGTWQQLHSNLIDGEGKRNAYWQACTDVQGSIHVSWVWRESPDVASNHDLCYAVSKDGGLSWQTSAGAQYQLPITAATAEYACRIPQKSSLINQTSMTADDAGRPFIATYWHDKDSAATQYHIVYKNNVSWQANSLGFRTTSFELGGAGTKRIPIARPQLLSWQKGNKTAAMLIFRDEELQNKPYAAITKDLAGNKWKLQALSNNPLGQWEPGFDTELWKSRGLLHLFIQKVEQVDGEGKAVIPPQPVQVLSVDIRK